MEHSREKSTSMLFWKFCNIIINAISTWHSDLEIIEKTTILKKLTLISHMGCISNNLKLISRSLDKNLVIFYYLFLAVILFHENELKLIKTKLIFRILHIWLFFILSNINLSFGAVIYLFRLLRHTRNRLLN